MLSEGLFLEVGKGVFAAVTTVYLPIDVRIIENRYDSQCSLGFFVELVHIEMLIHDLQ